MRGKKRNRGIGAAQDQFTHLMSDLPESDSDFIPPPRSTRQSSKPRSTTNSKRRDREIDAAQDQFAQPMSDLRESDSDDTPPPRSTRQSSKRQSTTNSKKRNREIDAAQDQLAHPMSDFPESDSDDTPPPRSMRQSSKQRRGIPNTLVSMDPGMEVPLGFTLKIRNMMSSPAFQALAHNDQIRFAQGHLPDFACTIGKKPYGIIPADPTCTRIKQKRVIEAYDGFESEWAESALVAIEKTRPYRENEARKFKDMTLACRAALLQDTGFVGFSQMWAWSLAFKCGYRGPPEPAELQLFF